MKLVKSFWASLLLELSAFISLKLKNPYFALLFFLSIHFIASFLATYFVYPLIPKAYRKSKGSYLIIFSSFFFFPIVGWLAYFILYAFVLRRQKEIVELPFSKVPVEDITISRFKVKRRSFGEATFQFLKKDLFRITDRFMSVLRELRTPASVELAKRALRSERDEIRLTAFSVISNLEREIYDSVGKLKELLSSEKDKNKVLEIYKKLALLYWELLYFNLVDKELTGFIEDEIIYYGEKVLAEKEDLEVCFVLGRVFLKRKEVEKALHYFSKVTSKGDNVLKMRVIPFFAEIEFYKKNYSKVKDLLRNYPLSFYPQIYFIKLLWEGKLRNGEKRQDNSSS